MRLTIDEADLEDLNNVLVAAVRQDQAWIMARHTSDAERAECRRRIRTIERIRRRLPKEIRDGVA